MIIKKVTGREVLDSRGNPTVEVEIHSGRHIARAIVPSGASTGKYEAIEQRDDGKRYFGKGVLKAANNVNILGKKLIGKMIDVNEIDEFLIDEDGNENKSLYGANSILGISLAATKLAALEKGIPLYKEFGNLAKNKKFSIPKPFFNVINGGAHAGNDLDVQEYMIVPQEKSFRENLRVGSEIYHELKEIIRKKYGKIATNVGDEGGFAPPLSKIEEPFDLILDAADKLGHKIKLAMDVAASQMRNGNDYILEGKKHSAFDLVDIYKGIVKTYPVISIEDPFSEEDWNSFFVLNKEIGRKVQIVGDDLLVTNKTRIAKAIELKSCNALLLKMNQIGTITETIDAAKLALNGKMKVMVSHRSGETEDTSIADLSVGLNCGQIKSGAPARGERTAKYNQLLRIEEELR
ncbi:phosphopyruvate hydratase [Candidatus Woesearchaeota archaeon]|nr:phosphopyruvate hydratase [Candidatus Woesearchaeota archaeon]